MGKETAEQQVKRLDYFGAIEHWGIGAEAFKRFYKNSSNGSLRELIEDYYEEVTRTLWLRENLFIPVGQIIALAGDFYGIPEKPISFGLNDDGDIDKEIRFLEAFETLQNCDSDELEALQDQFEKERQLIKKALERGEKPHIGLNCQGFLESNAPYAVITSFRYISLSLMNFDHFVEQAKEAYRIGHKVALKSALHAARTNDPKDLILALNQELFACHFLTDLFASGHQRVPRLEIRDYVEQHASSVFYIPIPEAARKILAGKIAMTMHDEDGDNGLTVKSEKHRDGWRAYGDGFYFDPEDQENQDRVCEVVQISLQEVYDTFTNKKFPQSHSYLEYLPKPKKVTSRRVVEGDVTQIEGLVFQPVQGKLHSLYEAVFICISDPKKNIESLREQVAEYIEENDNQFNISLKNEEKFTDYIKGIMNGTRQDFSVELNALMRVLERPIILIDSKGVLRNPADRKRYDSEPIFIFYHNQHCDAFILKNEYKKPEKYKELVKSLVRNFHPMFEVRNGTVQMRKDLSDRYCSTYVENWDPRKIWKFFSSHDSKILEEPLSESEQRDIEEQIAALAPSTLHSGAVI